MRISAMFTFLILTNCTSSTIISSRPTGANVVVDGQNLGEAPAQWSDTVWAGTKNNVQLSLPGYIDSRSIIAADQWSIGRVVVSVLCFFPGLLWSTDYRPSYEFALQPAAGWNQPSGQMPPGYYPPPIPPGAYPPPPAGDPNQPPPLPSRQGL